MAMKFIYCSISFLIVFSAFNANSQTANSIIAATSHEDYREKNSDSDKKLEELGATYGHKIKSIFMEKWILPSALSTEELEGLTAKVNMKFNLDMSIISTSIINSSGNKLFDDSVLGAIDRVRKESPSLPSPPEEIEANVFGGGINVKFKGAEGINYCKSADSNSLSGNSQKSVENIQPTVQSKSDSAENIDKSPVKNINTTADEVALNGEFSIQQPPVLIGVSNDINRFMTNWPCVRVNFTPGNILDYRRDMFSVESRIVRISSVSDGYFVLYNNSCIPIDLRPTSQGMFMNGAYPVLPGLTWQFKSSGIIFTSAGHIFETIMQNATIEFTSDGPIFHGIKSDTYDTNKAYETRFNSVEYNYDKIAIFTSRDEHGEMTIPDHAVQLSNDLQSTIKAKYRGREISCFAQNQDVVYKLDDNGNITGRLAILDFEGCPFQIENDWKIVPFLKFKTEKLIEITSVENGTFFISSDSSMPILHDGSKPTGFFNAYPIGTKIVFLSKGMEFTVAGYKYKTLKKNASINFTEKGIQLKGISKKYMETLQNSEPSIESNSGYVLTRDDVIRVMSGIASAIQSCGNGANDQIVMDVTIGEDGKVIYASAESPLTDEPIGKCAARVLRKARFPKSVQKLNVKYPFKL